VAMRVTAKAATTPRIAAAALAWRSRSSTHSSCRLLPGETAPAHHSGTHHHQAKEVIRMLRLHGWFWIGVMVVMMFFMML
jgi:hypothetical protein